MARADLVLEGGGVKGAGLVGAVSALTAVAEQYEFWRIAGTSAGAIVASLLAAGMDAAKVRTVMTDMDFARFEDAPGGPAGEAAGLLLHEGLFKGQVLHDWIRDNLARQGVHTWADLRLEQPGQPPERQYKLMVVVSDVARGRMLRLPWDYQRLCGIDPDTASVADAVRASASIPFFFRPWTMACDPAVTGGHKQLQLVDGGMLSNFPVDAFDAPEGAERRWPTFGIKLSAQLSLGQQRWASTSTPLSFAKALIGTMTNAHDQMFIDDPSVSSRTIFVDTTGYKSTDFHLTAEQKNDLYEKGVAAGEKFLASWNWDAWKTRYPAHGPSAATQA